MRQCKTMGKINSPSKPTFNTVQNYKTVAYVRELFQIYKSITVTAVKNTSLGFSQKLTYVLDYVICV